MEFQGFTLDKFQEDAIREVEANNSVIVSAPTGSGKTLIADYIIDRELKNNKRVIYTAPIKALSNQKYKDFCKTYGEHKIGLVTGDIVINSDAQILIMTTEVYRNMAIIQDPILEKVSYCIMDEIHFINDEERGHIWEESIIFSSNKMRFLFLSATVPNAKEFAEWVKSIKKHEVKVIKHHTRSVPLDIKFFDKELGITTLDKIQEQKYLDGRPSYKGSYTKMKKGNTKIAAPSPEEVIKEISDKVPAIYFVFSRKKTQDYAEKTAAKMKLLSNEEQGRMTTFIAKEFGSLNREVQSLKSTRTLRKTLAKGIAFHHAGLLPDTKHIVEKLFATGLIKVLFATETFAVGINMPAKTVCLDSLRKYTGAGFRYLNSKEFYQMSGRAGRRGIDKTGLSLTIIHRPSADIEKIRSLTDKDMLPLKSQFKLSYNTVLNMKYRHSPKEIDKILQKNFYTFQETKGKLQMLSKINSRYESIEKTLKGLDYIDKDNHLTNLGIFTTKIFANEIPISQIFEEGIIDDLDSYKTLLILAALLYEEKKDATFYKRYSDEKSRELAKKIAKYNILKKDKWYKKIKDMTALIYPLFEEKTFIQILSNTNFPEGDLIRLFMQILDRLEQIEKATNKHEIEEVAISAKKILRQCMEGIHTF